MRILLVEDEESIRETLKLNLELEGYEVVSTANGRKALEYIGGQHFDLLLLDVMLPEVDGFTIAKQVRLGNPDVPILILTAKDMAQDRVQGLKKGADDYLTKPFNLEELLLRVGSLLRRSKHAQGEVSETYEFGQNKVNFTTYQAETFRGEHPTLTKKEALLLKLLVERKNRSNRYQQPDPPGGLGLRCVPQHPHHRQFSPWRFANTLRKTPKTQVFSLDAGSRVSVFSTGMNWLGVGCWGENFFSKKFSPRNTEPPTNSFTTRGVGNLFVCGGCRGEFRFNTSQSIK